MPYWRKPTSKARSMQNPSLRNTESASSRIFRHPFARLFVFLVVLMVIRIGIATVEHDVLSIKKEGASAWYNLLSLLVFVMGYLGLVRTLERRRVTELDRKRALPEAALGVIVSVVLFTTIIGIIAAAGAYTVTGARLPNGLWAALTLWVFIAVSEEIGFRAVIFRLVEERAGSGIALLISAIIFGALHLTNEDASLAGVAGIALGSGIFYAAVFMITRRLWTVIGLHFAWNFVEGSFYGVPVSGYDFDGILVSSLVGPNWLTGGAFGPEASIPALAILVGASIATLLMSYRSGQFIRSGRRG